MRELSSLLRHHPVTGGRLTAIVWGDTYSEPGQWQGLKLTNLQKQFEAEVVQLRQRFGPEIEVDDAFIDAIVTNIYTGPGRYRLQLDDLNLQGHISLPSVGREIPANWRESWLWRPESINPEGRFWNALNRPEVWLQYQGEFTPLVKVAGRHGIDRQSCSERRSVASDSRCEAIRRLPTAASKHRLHRCIVLRNSRLVDRLCTRQQSNPNRARPSRSPRTDAINFEATNLR